MNETIDEDIFIANIATRTVSTPLHNTLPPLHDRLIQYAIGLCRLLYIQDVSSWNDWSTDVAGSQDITPHEACATFLNDVLPIVNTYKLSQRVKKRLRLLDMHPCFRRIGQGYQYAPNLELANRFVLQVNRDYRLASALPTSIDSGPASHTVLINCEAIEQKACVGYNLKVHPEFACLFSVMISTDLELSIAQKHDLDEIHRRLRRARQSFEDTASLAPFRRSIDELVCNVDIFHKLKTKISKVVNGNMRL